VSRIVKRRILGGGRIHGVEKANKLIGMKQTGAKVWKIEPKEFLGGIQGGKPSGAGNKRKRPVKKDWRRCGRGKNE